jgi:hypothetical protein
LHRLPFTETILDTYEERVVKELEVRGAEDEKEETHTNE